MKRCFLGAAALGVVCCLAMMGCHVRAEAGLSSDGHDSNRANYEYESCDNGASCAGGSGTTCEQTEFQSGAGYGQMCTASCYTSADCPPDFNGGRVACVINAGQPSGQCYIDCSYDNGYDCKGGTSCVSLDGFQICAP